MTTNTLEHGQSILALLSEENLEAVVHWMELLLHTQDNPEIEPEELWLLASGKLAEFNQEIDNAQPIEDWRKYLDEI